MGTQITKNKGGYLYLDSPREQLMKMLVEKTLATGHRLSFKEVSKDSEMPEPNNYAPYYGSFDKAAELAWKKATDPKRKNGTSASGVVQIPKHLKKPESMMGESLKHRRYKALIKKRLYESMPLSSDMMSAPIGDDTTVTSDDVATMPLFDDTIQTEPDIQPVEPKQEKARKPAGRRPYSYDKIRGQVIAFYRRNGRMPKREDIEYDLSFPSWGTIYKYLGRQSEWEKLIPPSLLEPANPNDDASPVEADITTAGENDTTPNDGAFVTESEVVDSTSSEQSQDDVVITTQHHWEEQILHAEISISKPGVSTPIRITISV